MHDVRRLRPRKSEREAVAKGAALLDAEKPGWADKIDLGKLNLESEFCCVLGQLFDEPVTIPRWQALGYTSMKDMLEQPHFHGITRSYANQGVCQANYEAGKNILGLDADAVVVHGFEQDWEGPERTRTRYAGLDVAWAREVRQRQKAAR